MGRSNLSVGDNAVKFINKLTHTGDFNGRPFKLRPWQESFVRELFTIRPDGFRQYKKAFLGIGRKSGKTELVAAILLFLLFGQGSRKTYQEIYSASGDRKQAGLVHKAAAQMIDNSPYLSSLCHVYRGNIKRIEVPSLNNTFEALSSDAPTKHGLNPSAVLFDEVHVYPNSDLHDTLTSAFGARFDPLSIYITTAGRNKNTLCYDIWKYAEAVLAEPQRDPGFLTRIYQAPNEADWTDPEVWKLALPGLGDFTNLEFIKAECEKAKISPAYEATFRQLYLNQWIEDTLLSWLPVSEFDLCKSDIDWSEYAGRSCFGGLDLSSSRDLNALCLIFPEDDGKLTVYLKYWVPGDSALHREREGDGVPYTKWLRDGWLEMSGGRTTDQEQIILDILEISRTFDIRAIAYDPWNARLLAQTLSNGGLEMQDIRQDYQNLNLPSKRLETLLLNHQLRHDGNPVLRWNAANCGIESNGDVIKPSKKRSKGRIDGIAALVNALALVLNNQLEPPQPVRIIEDGPLFL